MSNDQTEIRRSQGGHIEAKQIIIGKNLSMDTVQVPIIYLSKSLKTSLDLSNFAVSSKQNKKKHSQSE